MNAVTRTETRAVNTATSSTTNVLQAADPSKNLILVPLSRLVLRPTGRNVRKTPRMSIPELAASIQRVGLLQNLIVIPAADGEHYEVVAGGRRLVALKLLAKKHRIAKNWQVPCLRVADGTARTASLTENVQREAMHPADQFEAFAALVAEGRPIEDIAADFSVTPLVVQRRLKLANVSPRLMADYRADAVTLDQLMALSITDDPAAQEAAFYDAPTWQRSPHNLRERLTEREIDAYRHPLVRFVGLDTYEQAGGGVRRDLFAEGDAGVYLTDAALLERLAQDRLGGIAAEVKTEGWAWVDIAPAATYADLQAFQRAPREQREPNKREALRIEKLQAKMREVAEALDAAMDAEDEDKAEGLQEEGEALGQQLQALEDGLQGYAPSVKAAAGAIVTIDRNGEAVIHRGLLREAEAKALRMLERLRQGFGDEEAGNDDEGENDETPKATLSDRLAQRLSAHRTAALQIEVTRHPQVALAALVHGMVQTVLRARPAAGRAPDGARPAGRHGPGLAGIVRRRGAARIAAGMGWQTAREQRRTVCRAAGDGARRTGQAAGRVRGIHGGRGDAACHGTPTRQGTGAGRGPQHGRMVAAERRRLLQARFQGRDSGCRGRVCTGIRHPAGEAQEGRHCQRGRAAGRWHGLDARHLQGRKPAGSGAGRRPGAGCPGGRRGNGG